MNPFFACSTEHTVAPRLVDTMWAGLPLYVFPFQKKWARLSTWVTETPWKIIPI